MDLEFLRECDKVVVYEHCRCEHRGWNARIQKLEFIDNLCNMATPDRQNVEPPTITPVPDTRSVTSLCDACQDCLLEDGDGSQVVCICNDNFPDSDDTWNNSIDFIISEREEDLKKTSPHSTDRKLNRKNNLRTSTKIHQDECILIKKVQPTVIPKKQWKLMDLLCPVSLVETKLPSKLDAKQH